MKTQKIVLALALATVTPAVLSAQDYVGGPGSKMLYIADNALARIRQHERNQERNQEPAPQNKTTTTTTPTTAPTTNPLSSVNLYPYGPEGHAMLAGEIALSRLSARRQERRANRRANGNQNTPAPSNTSRSNRSSEHSPYLGLQSHHERDARQDSTPAPSHVQDADALNRNHQVTLDSRTADRSTKKTNNTFRYYLNEVGRAIANEAPYMK